MITIAGILFVLALIMLVFEAQVAAALFGLAFLVIVVWVFIAALPLLILVGIPLLLIYLIVKALK
jgi:hypothetical protein